MTATPAYFQQRLWRKFLSVENSFKKQTLLNSSLGRERVEGLKELKTARETCKRVWSMISTQRTTF